MRNRIETGNGLEISFPVLILIGHLAFTGQSRANTAQHITQRALLTWSFFLSLALWPRIASSFMEVEGWGGG